MDRRNIYIIVAVVVVLAVLGYALGWFGGSRTPTAVNPPPAPTPPAAAPAPSPRAGTHPSAGEPRSSPVASAVRQFRSDLLSIGDGGSAATAIRLCPNGSGEVVVHAVAMASINGCVASSPPGPRCLAHRTELRARVGLRRKDQPIGGKGRLGLPKIE